MRELALATILALAALLVVLGVNEWSGPVALIVAGVLLAAIALATFRGPS